MIRPTDPTDLGSGDFDPEDDRYFDAVRYLLDEMTPAEVDQFEEQLAVDQSLRELLSEAVLVTHATYAAHLNPTPQPQADLTERPAEASPHRGAPVSTSSQAGMLLALAAALLLAAVGTLWMTLYAGSSDVAADAPSEEVQLAAAWVERLEDQADDDSPLWDDDLLSSTLTEMPLDSEEQDSLLDASPAAPPAWMLKALAAQQEDDANSPTM